MSAAYPNKSPFPETEAQAYVAHMATRPATAAMVGLLASFPVVKIFASNGVPLMLARERSRIRKEQEEATNVAVNDF